MSTIGIGAFFHNKETDQFMIVDRLEAEVEGYSVQVVVETTTKPRLKPWLEGETRRRSLSDFLAEIGNWHRLDEEVTR